MQLIRMHARISGQVQGIFFRASTHECASETSVEMLVKWLWEGPPGAEVENIEMKQTPIAALELEGFQIRY
jgi:acylphosphatase